MATLDLTNLCAPENYSVFYLCDQQTNSDKWAKASVIQVFSACCCPVSLGRASTKEFVQGTEVQQNGQTKMCRVDRSGQTDEWLGKLHPEILLVKICV